MRAILFDLDGTVYEHGKELPGAARAIATLRERGLEVGFVTNTSSRSRRHLVERLEGMGIPAPAPTISTALVAGAAHLRAGGFRRVEALVPEAALEDLADFTITGDDPEAVLVGDLDDAWNFEILNRAFRHLMNGATLIALSADRYWQQNGGLVLDCGPFVKALEYASGQTAAVCGKPSAEFYRTALATLGEWALEEPDQVLMVGDDIWGDIRGAQEAGLKACLLRSGKFREEVYRSSGITPDLLLPAIGDLPAAL